MQFSLEFWTEKRIRTAQMVRTVQKYFDHNHWVMAIFSIFYQTFLRLKELGGSMSLEFRVWNSFKKHKLLFFAINAIKGWNKELSNKNQTRSVGCHQTNYNHHSIVDNCALLNVHIRQKIDFMEYNSWLFTS